jgi:hypothetical protein
MHEQYDCLGESVYRKIFEGGANLQRRVRQQWTHPFGSTSLPEGDNVNFSKLSPRLSRWRSVVSVGALLLAGIFSTVSQAHDGTWTITRHSGDVRLVTDGVVLSSLSENMALRPGTGIRTGENGRIMLVHAGESMMISPNSSLTIPNTYAKNDYTTLLQKRGSALFAVEKDQGRPFRVLTPYLAAVVKGTQFTITLAADDNRVEVLEGQVDVSEFRTGQVGSVSAGQTAVVQTASEGLRVIGSGFIQPIRQGAPLPSPTIPDVEAEQSADSGTGAAKASSRSDPASDMRTQGHASMTHGAMNSGSASVNDPKAAGGTVDFPDVSWAGQLAVPLAIGIAVAFGAAVRTQRKKRKNKNKADLKK